ncbi:MAG TPA: LysM peptidoglycan-binding domain-containing protein [Ornithinimicrobium sp.]|uniref:LysM peptidoglycan-binding domain-containing protein n=1 Tax=Ornithinimicrobium sp. TaxID=1977084 RepID=UPI002B484FC1|nr:LysM peptidoglycan-binding domain-containing protein [Ornithinimicrobium sp.]HKJ12554.1 LysM peptidoglycan-binding domain-containing protein [Ornithinimicrobium sp.]
MSAVAAERFAPVAPGLRERHLRLAPAAGAGGRRQEQVWRLTRRGRLTLTVSLTLAVVAALVSATLMLGPASASSEVVVQPGQTLSEIAATHLPHLPLDRAIVTLQRENQLNSLHLQTGQTLVVP